MHKNILLAVFATLVFWTLPLQKAQAKDGNNTAETVIHLLSYVAKDYVVAVQDGKVISIQEYKEQQEFSQRAYALTKQNNFASGTVKENLLTQLQTLITKVNQKAPGEQISKIANDIINKIIASTGIKTAPKTWPSLAKGKQLYQQNCATCHGKTGNGKGPAGLHLSPKPSNFLDPGLMANLSPFQAYSSIRLGVPGTAMTSWTNFSNAEIWDLAFYVQSLQFQSTATDSIRLRKAFQKIQSKIGLSQVASLSDQALLQKIKTHTKEGAKTKLKALRLLAPVGKNKNNSLVIAKKRLKDALNSYLEGQKSIAKTQAISAYLEGIEPVEAQLRTIDKTFVVELETKMFEVRQAIANNQGTAIIKTKVKSALTAIEEAETLLGKQELDYWLTFILAASIMLREALEAFLIIGVIIAVIRSTGIKKALPWVHGGWITAVVFGLAGWFLADYIIQFGGKNREIMEGLAALVAMLVLVFAGFWLHNKTYAQKWSQFVNEKIGGYLKKERMFGLAAFSFMVVFREAFEVVLFLQAINIESAGAHKSAIGFGSLAALAGIGVIAFLFLKYTKKVPIQYIFKYSSWLIVLLAIILAGKGFHALQEAGWIGITQLSTMFRIDWLGIYPTLQTLLAQVALIAIIVATYFINQRKQLRAESIKQGSH